MLASKRSTSFSCAELRRLAVKISLFTLMVFKAFTLCLASFFIYKGGSPDKPGMKARTTGRTIGVAAASGSVAHRRIPGAATTELNNDMDDAFPSPSWWRIPSCPRSSARCDVSENHRWDCQLLRPVVKEQMMCSRHPRRCSMNHCLARGLEQAGIASTGGE